MRHIGLRFNITQRIGHAERPRHAGTRPTPRQQDFHRRQSLAEEIAAALSRIGGGPTFGGGATASAA